MRYIQSMHNEYATYTHTHFIHSFTREELEPHNIRTKRLQSKALQLNDKSKLLPSDSQQLLAFLKLEIGEWQFYIIIKSRTMIFTSYQVISFPFQIILEVCINEFHEIIFLIYSKFCHQDNRNCFKARMGRYQNVKK